MERKNEEYEIERVGIGNFSVRYFIKTSYCTSFIPAEGGSPRTVTIVIYVRRVRTRMEKEGNELELEYNCSMAGGCRNMACEFARRVHILPSPAPAQEQRKNMP
jgi:hypothetical protein